MVHIPEHLRFKFSQQLLEQLEGIGTPVKVLIQVAAGQVSIAASTIASLGGRIEFQSELTNQVSLTIDDSQLSALASSAPS